MKAPMKRRMDKMKRILSLIFSMVLCVTLTACSNNQVGDKDNNSEDVPSASPTAPVTVTDVPTESDNSADDLENMYDAYVTALENLLQNNILPDGTDYEELLGDMSENKFAIYDVDNDGKEELIILYFTTSTAGMAGYIFAYDSETETFQRKLYEFPLLTFYDNGVVKALWSHNQGRAGDFWPYNLYQYNTDSESYVLVGMVDAWDKNYMETDNQNNPFPSDIDKSKTGFVYYIMEDGEYDNTNPVDASVYDDWTNTYIGDALEIQIQYMDLTEDSIMQIRDGL